MYLFRTHTLKQAERPAWLSCGRIRADGRGWGGRETFLWLKGRNSLNTLARATGSLEQPNDISEVSAHENHTIPLHGILSFNKVFWAFCLKIMSHPQFLLGDKDRQLWAGQRKPGPSPGNQPSRLASSGWPQVETLAFHWLKGWCNLDLFFLLQSENERNYHIFYQLCACAQQSELKHLKLGMWRGWGGADERVLFWRPLNF